MAITRDVLNLESEFYAFTTDRLDAQSDAIIRAWVQAWEMVEGDVESALMEMAAASRTGRVTRTMMLRNQRLQAALGRMSAALERAVGDTVNVLTTQLRSDIQAAAANQSAILAAQLPAQIGAAGTSLAPISVVAADADQIAAMVRRTTERITKTTWPLAAEAQTSIRRQLLRGIAVGANPRQAARRAVQATEDAFNGGVARALNIARTEMLDAHRVAAQAVDERNADIVAGWRWEAHLGKRTCRACLAMHGQTFDADIPGPQGHQSCRCARITVTKSWAELGFTGIREPVSLHRSSEAYFNRLSEANQRAILGDRGYAAWQSGEYPIDQWAARQDNAGWRPSYVATRPPTV